MMREANKRRKNGPRKMMGSIDMKISTAIVGRNPCKKALIAGLEDTRGSKKGSFSDKYCMQKARDRTSESL